ncbi:pentatricopeptide repeat-containing protein At5g16860-like isoform X1 [Selaginella moellendorffii]|uniref:pentatricopeptide repeat-containing protein At5g16860-like isoform X1 n=1 Tax=Selaginella moellendorffii TaxID=88036 RepID=UPI000D1CF9C7|nr:pentatricopeptide repeat-containing protein At5g16860-like isoform X1 [Selaginella moellendorffii]|eukprot:XP_024521752.1 pentatricopeptide repeat-containing protein At5g16860-like isoform X1 [Selaginella moellendorffii]
MQPWPVASFQHSSNASVRGVALVLSQLKSCRDIGEARKIHASVIDNGLEDDLYVASSLVTVYSRCGSLVDASKVFHKMKHRDAIAWNALIRAYAVSGHFSERALELFLAMEAECVANGRTFVAVLKAVTSLAEEEGANPWKMTSLERGMAIHARSRMQNLVLRDFYVGSSLIDMYSKCGSMQDARRAFEEMETLDVVSWNTLMLGYVDNDQGEIALELFESLESSSHVSSCAASNSRTFVVALKACSNLARKEDGCELGDGELVKVKSLEKGMALHSEAARRSLVDARTAFDNIQERLRDCVSWNTMLLGYVESGEAHLALELYQEMVSGDLQCRPDLWTCSCALKACAILPSLQLGKTIHREIHRRGFEPDSVLLTCLLDLYGKCGNMAAAQHVFDSTSLKRNLVSWNALLEGYSQKGDSTLVFEEFYQLIDAGLKPDSATFLSILAVCNHCGLVKEGKLWLQLMSSWYEVRPSTAHYHCVIDLLARADELDEAMIMMEEMPVEADNITWKILSQTSNKIDHARTECKHVHSKVPGKNGIVWMSSLASSK